MINVSNIFYPTLTLPDILGREPDFLISPLYKGGLRGVISLINTSPSFYHPFANFAINCLTSFQDYSFLLQNGLPQFNWFTGQAKRAYFGNFYLHQLPFEFFDVAAKKGQTITACASHYLGLIFRILVFY